MLTGEYPPRIGGIADYTARLAQALRELGHEVTVLTGSGQADAAHPAALRQVSDWGFGCWRQVEAAQDVTGAEVLHTQYQAGAFDLKGAVNLLPLFLRWRRSRLRIVTTFHDLRPPYLFPKAGPLRSLAVRALLMGSHGAIFCDGADLARAGTSGNRRWLPVGSNTPCDPPAGFDRVATRRALGAGEGDLLIGYFGFLTFSKRAGVLLRSLRLLLDEGRSARVVLIGASVGSSNPMDRADKESLLALTEMLRLQERVHFTGYLRSPAVSAHLLSCDVVALPYDEGASFNRGSLMAALEHGRPIVTTTPHPSARGSRPRLLEPGRQFLAVPPDNPAALADAIARLADDQQLAASLGREARELAAHCSWSAIARETAEVYAGC